jgi:O-antigen/teichoic acid export membrane protein
LNKNKELVKNTIIIFIGKFCTQFITLLLLPLYTHFLSTEDYGYIDLIQTYLTFFIPLILLKIDAGIFRFLIDARKSEEEKNKIITNGIFIMFVELIISTILFAVAVKIFSIKYSILIVMNLISLSVLTFLLQIVRGIGKNKQYSFSSIIAAIVTIVLNLIFLVGFHKNGKYVLIASLISNIICTIYLLIANKILKNVKIKYIDKKLIKDLLKYSIPMIPNELSWWIVHVSDRTIISYALGVAANGIYSVSCKFSNILSSIFNIFNLSWQESAALHINDTDKDEFFSNVINKVFNLFICFCIGILACLPFVFELLIKDSYREAYKYVPILLLANIFSVLIGLIGSIYVAKKMTKEVAKTTMIAAIINLTIDIALIKVIGIYAAAISTLVSYMLLAIYRYIDVQKYVKVKIPIKNIVVNSIIFILVVVLYLYNNIALNVINLLLCILYAIIVNKELLIEFKKVIGKKVKNIN